MNSILNFVLANSALLTALLALAISLRANYTSHQAHKLNLRNKADAERILLFEKKRELLNEVDRQHIRFATLMMLTAQKLLLIKEQPQLHETIQDDFDRLKSNLSALQVIDRYDEQRAEIEAINVGADIAMQDELLATIRRLTIHMEKDIAHEQASLNDLQARARESNGAKCQL